MRTNLPLVDQEYNYPSDLVLVSTTDVRGVITHGNEAFFAVSGFDYEELVGQPHNVIRHPDMPPAAFKDLWRTIGSGLPWTGLVKNRRKDGTYYWVRANVTPQMENGKPVGYVSVRTKPAVEETRTAQALYNKINAEQSSGSPSITILRGQVRALGWRGFLQKGQDLPLSVRVALMMAVVMIFGMLPLSFGLQGPSLAWAQLLGMLVGASISMATFKRRWESQLNQVTRFARDLASCNLTTSLDFSPSSPLVAVLSPLRQVQINLKAVLHDVNDEVDSFNKAAAEISNASIDLSSRTESQASSLEQTAASMEEISETVQNTAQTAAQVLRHSRQSTEIASSGGQAVQEVSVAMREIDQSANRMREIISVIEGIAFQTNILALNAAVEAARAGEQGRGFAVVASEVRALAQRSATAAKEIRELIAQSADQISKGSSKMQGANKTIEEAVKSVREMGTLVNEISNAAREQSAGITQVNEAMVHLDQLTQQNAAMAQESAASAEELQQSSVKLARSIGIFRL
jgi:aerotaxis receptor